MRKLGRGRAYDMRMYPKDRDRITIGVNTALYNPLGDNTYDVRGHHDEVYLGGWFSCGWFPADIWWGEGDTT